MDITNARAIVTGGARGMGMHFAQAFKDAGAQVVFCDVSPDGVEATSAEIGVKGIVADISDEEAVGRLFDEATEILGGTPTVLINNAGILRDGLLVKKDRETGEVKVLSTKKWQQVIDVNLTGQFLCFREFAKRCIETDTKPAVCVNMSSISKDGNMGQSNYSAAKAALAADTVVWAKEVSRYGIRVGAIAPGFIRTPMVESMPEKVLEKVLQPVPLRRLGEPAEIFQAIRFIVECEYFTGRVIQVDGGLRL